MKIEKTEIETYKTYEYEIFNDLVGNREVKPERINAIKESIEIR